MSRAFTLSASGLRQLEALAAMATRTGARLCVVGPDGTRFEAAPLTGEPGGASVAADDPDAALKRFEPQRHAPRPA